MDPGAMGVVRQPPDTIHSCSKCKRVTNGIESVSIHKTLAYTRCRCHRLFRYSKPHSTSRVSTTSGIPEPISILASKRTSRIIESKQADLPETSLIAATTKTSDWLSSSSSCIQSRSTCLSSKTALKSTSDIKLPPIAKKPSLVDIPFNSASRDTGYRTINPDAKTTIANTTNIPQLSSDSATIVINPLLRLNREFESPQCQQKKRVKVDFFTISDMVYYIPQRKRNKLRLLFKRLDTDDDGHLSLTEFMGGLPCEQTNSDQEFLKQIHIALSCETYFGIKEFTLGYCIAECLSKWSSRLKQEYEMTERFLTMLTSLMAILTNKSCIDGFVSTAAVMESIEEIQATCNIQVVQPTLAKVVTDGKIHLIKFLSLSPYFLHCIT